MSRFHRLASVGLAALLLAITGCGAVATILLEDFGNLPVKNEAGVLAVGQQFGEAIRKENYPAAYKLLTISRRADQSLEQFVSECKRQREQYFEGFTPAKVDTVAYMLHKHELPSLPADFKYESLLGVCEVSWDVTLPDMPIDDDVELAMGLDVIVVDEAGQPKIAHIDWADEF